jgi:pyridoxamine 5'-phosphate oxidase
MTEFQVLENDSDPIAVFDRWFKAAQKLKLVEPTAATLSTVSKTGQPNARVILLKGVKDGGFEFFTNYQSQKAQDLEANDKCALLFYYDEVGRQIRIRGTATKLTAQESDAYFHSRPYESRLGAWASKQSSTLEDKSVIRQNLARYEIEFGEKVPRPYFWGGYRIQPTEIEFWIKGDHRLHDRFLFTKTSKKNVWARSILSP